MKITASEAKMIMNTKIKDSLSNVFIDIKNTAKQGKSSVIIQDLTPDQLDFLEDCCGFNIKQRRHSTYVISWA